MKTLFIIPLIIEYYGNEASLNLNIVFYRGGEEVTYISYLTPMGIKQHTHQDSCEFKVS